MYKGYKTITSDLSNMLGNPMARIKIGKALKLQFYAGMAVALSQPLEAGSAHAGPLLAAGRAHPAPLIVMMMMVMGPPPASCSVPGSNDFSSVAQCMTTSVENLPGLLTALAYCLGLVMGSMAIVKMKEHVENPANTPLKDCAVRMVAGGALFALPIVYEAMLNTVGNNGTGASAATLYKARFNAL